MAETNQEKPGTPLIVVRRKKIVRGHTGAHGGAWKIAYADFVTAMMAFFLLMWLLMASNHGTLQGIADYFNRPLSAAFKNGPGVAQVNPRVDVAKDKNVEKDKDKGQDAETLKNLQKTLQTMVQQNPKLAAFKNQIKIDVTTEGLRIQIVDDKDRPMFAVGSAVLEDYTKSILDQIGRTLNGVPNPISITGHTDSLSYSGRQAGYSNWELSSDRAAAARRQLIAGGMNPNKVLEIRGLADAIPLFKNDPTNPGNRRISIVVMNQATVQSFKENGSTINVNESQPLDSGSVTP